MPEKNSWDDIRKRLQNYSEEPIDNWENISSALSSNQVKTRLAKYWITSAFIGIVFLLAPHKLKDYLIDQASDKEFMQRSLSTNTLAEQHRPINIKKRPVASNSRSVNPEKRTDAASPQLRIETRTEMEFVHSKDQALAKIETANISVEYFPILSNQILLSDSIKIDSLSLSKTSRTDSLQKVTEAIIIPKEKKSPFTYYALLTPSLNYYSITSKEALNGRVNGFDSKGVFSTDRVGVSAEVGIQFPVRKKLLFFSGFSYYYQNQKLVYRFTHSDLLEVAKEEGTLTYTITPHQSLKTINYQMSNIGLNLGLLYEINDRSGLSQKAGLSLLYQYGLAKNETSYQNRSSRYWGYQLSYQMTFKMSSQTFFIQPSLTRLIGSNESLHEPITIKTTRAGIGIGLIF